MFPNGPLGGWTTLFTGAGELTTSANDLVIGGVLNSLPTSPSLCGIVGGTLPGLGGVYVPIMGSGPPGMDIISTC